MNDFILHTDLITEGNLGKGTSPEVLLPHIETAIIETKLMIGADQFNTIAELTSDKEENIILKKAVTNLALSYAVHAMNIETNGKGIVRATGFNESRNELLSRNEVKDLSEHFKSIATKLFQQFLPVEESTEDNPADEVNLGCGFMSSI